MKGIPMSGATRLQRSSVVNEAVRDRGIEVVLSEDNVKRFCSERYDARTGARGLPGVVNTQLEPQVTDAILNGQTGKMEFDYENGKFVLKN
jgi:ATP-dependent Clp protease ATP-binding subunit ClpA